MVKMCFLFSLFFCVNYEEWKPLLTIIFLSLSQIKIITNFITINYHIRVPNKSYTIVILDFKKQKPHPILS